MFKQGWKLVGWLVIAAILFIWLVKAPALSAYATYKLGIEVTFRSISLWPKEATIRHFRLANPPHFQDRSAFEVEKISLFYRLKALFGRPAEIDEIILDNVVLNIEIKNGDLRNNNWAAIGAHLARHKAEKKEVIIHKLILRNITVRTEGAAAKLLGINGTRHFDQMEFSEINSLEGFPTKELIRQIFQNAGLMQILEQFLSPVQDIKDALNPLNIFGK